MFPFRKKKKPAFDPAQLPDPLALVPALTPGVEAREDAVGVQVRRVLPPKPGMYALFARLLHYRHDIRVNLDAAGAFFWNQVDGRRDLDAIAQAMQARFDFDPHRCRQAVLTFARDLTLRRLIVLEIPGPGGVQSPKSKVQSQDASVRPSPRP